MKLVFPDLSNKLCKLMLGKINRFGQLDRLQPNFRFCLPLLDMDMRRLGAVSAPEMEAVSFPAHERRHGVATLPFILIITD